MAIPICLSSDDGRQNLKSHDFTTAFKPEIVLDRHTDHYIGLNKIELSYSWHNVSGNYQNTTLKYSLDNGTAWTNIKFPTGNYTYNDLANYINSVISKNGHNSSDDNKDIKFIFYPTILRISIILSNTFQIDITEGNFHKLIGNTAEIILVSEFGNTLPNITNSVDSILVHCNLLSESLVFGINSDVLELISVSGLSLSYPFSFEPKIILFNKINTNNINKIQIYITDTQDRPLDLIMYQYHYH